MLPAVQFKGSILEQVAVTEFIPMLLMLVILKIINSKRLVTSESLHFDGTQTEKLGFNLPNAAEKFKCNPRL